MGSRIRRAETGSGEGQREAGGGQEEPTGANRGPCVRVSRLPELNGITMIAKKETKKQQL